MFFGIGGLSRMDVLEIDVFVADLAGVAGTKKVDLVADVAIGAMENQPNDAASDPEQ